MKALFWIFAIITCATFCARAELEDVTNGVVIHPAVTCLTNETSTQELQDVLGVNAHHFTVHRSSLTNGLGVYVEINIEGKRPMEITHVNLDRGTLENEHAGQDIPVFIAVNPVGSLDGEGIYSAKKLRCFLREAGVSGSGTADNPFYKNKSGILYWSQIPLRESATTYKFMEGHSGTNSTGSKIEMRVRFHEF